MPDFSKHVKRGKELLLNSQTRPFVIAGATMGWNLVYGIFCGLLGVVYDSGWFYAMFAYYVALGLMRMLVVDAKRHGTPKARRRAVLLCGWGLILLAVILSLITMFTIEDSIGTAYHMVVMIAMAAYTFYIFINAIVRTVKAHRRKDRLEVALRNISFAAAIGAMLSLERSMLSTFGSSTDRFTYVMEGTSGMGAFLIVLGLGISMLVSVAKMNKILEN